MPVALLIVDVYTWVLLPHTALLPLIALTLGTPFVTVTFNVFDILKPQLLNAFTTTIPLFVPAVTVILVPLLNPVKLHVLGNVHT